MVLRPIKCSRALSGCVESGDILAIGIYSITKLINLLDPTNEVGQFGRIKGALTVVYRDRVVMARMPETDGHALHVPPVLVLRREPSIRLPEPPRFERIDRDQQVLASWHFLIPPCKQNTLNYAAKSRVKLCIVNNIRAHARV